jgi:hypothetical protein
MATGNNNRNICLIVISHFLWHPPPGWPHANHEIGNRKSIGRLSPSKTNKPFVYPDVAKSMMVGTVGSLRTAVNSVLKPTFCTPRDHRENALLSDRAFDVLRPGLPGARRVNAAVKRMRTALSHSSNVRRLFGSARVSAIVQDAGC